MTCCKAEEYEWCKDLPVILAGNAKAYCVFHAPTGEKGCSLEDFNHQVFELIERIPEGQYCNLSGTIFEGDIVFSCYDKYRSFPDISLSHAHFNGQVSFTYAQFNGSASFTGAQFSREALFDGAQLKGYASFSEAQFYEYATFHETLFNGGSGFNNARFSKKANFHGVQFGGGSDFSEAQFSGESWFRDAKFNDEANFRNAEFIGETWFVGTQFNGDVSFVGVEFIYALFVGSQFSYSALFMAGRFSEKADFSEAQFSGRTIFHSVTFGTASFNKSIVVSKLVFEKCTFEVEVKFQELSVKGQLLFDGSDLRKASFMHTNITNIDFRNPQWQEENGFYILQDEFDIRKNIKGTVKELEKSWFPVKTLFGIAKLKWWEPDRAGYDNIRILYRRFKQRCINEQNESDASKWHYREMEMLRKATSIKDFLQFITINLYWASSGYGENTSRALFMLSALLIVITTLFGFFGINWTAHKIDIGNLFLNTLNIATFEKNSTLPLQQPCGGYLKIFTKILIPAQAALFVLALRNRYRR